MSNNIYDLKTNKPSSLISHRKLISELPLKEESEWVIGGFLRSIKSVGKLNFAILADCSGKIQILFKTPIDSRKESVIIVKGKLVKRKSPNPNIPLGEWELIADSYEVISESLKPLPFELLDAADEALEPTRLKYRYLDLRRNNCQNLIKKSQIMNALRETLIANSFVEVNTPSLSVSSKEGANTFDTYIKKNGKMAKFSLAQSPQLYKQLLMISGLEKYFQFANCFRLEDLRSDRQYEFLQLDIEVAYSDEQRFFSIIESAFKHVLKTALGVEIETPFKRIPYNECLEKYGSDKPDLRYGLEIEKLNLEALTKANGHTEVYGFYLKNCSIHVVEQKWLKSLQTNNDIYIVHVENGKITKAHLMKEGMPEYKGKGLEIGVDIPLHQSPISGAWIVTTACFKTKKNALTSLGNLRFHFSRRPKGEIKKMLEFVWVVDWPLFEWNEAKNDWEVAHHLFTRPVSNSVGFDKTKERSLGYDLVLNGVELASGSQRNYLLDVQKYMFEVAGLTQKEVEENFVWFLEALNYGVPPHMGIAIGIDRLAQTLLNTETIRDVIAFPKNNHGVCPLTNAPLEE